MSSASFGSCIQTCPLLMLPVALDCHGGSWVTGQAQLLLVGCSFLGLCLGRWAMHLLSSSFSKLCGYFYFKVTGRSLLRSTSFSLLFKSQTDFISFSLSSRASLCQSLFTPRWHSCSSLSWDPKTEGLTGNEIYDNK